MVVTTRIRIDRISSSTRNAQVAADAIVGPAIVAEEGYVLAVRLLADKATYNTVEDLSGRMVPLRAGDVLAGTLGSRRALRGYAGEVPRSIAPGDTIEVLNLGGILGRCTSVNPDVGPPFQAEVLGAVLAFPALGDRVGRPAHIRDHAIPAAEILDCPVPVVYVAGTCMNAGKTRAACEVISRLNQRGYRLGALKVSGVACLKDTLNMEDHGAIDSLSFLDAGAPSTAGFEDLVPMARGLLNEIGQKPVDAIVVELGDGIIGGYGVASLYKDAAIMKAVRAHIMCANDLVAAWGARELAVKQLGKPIDVMSGPATDNEVGERYVENELKIPAANARTRGEKLANLVAAKLFGPA